ncbi:MAG TPA: hypothetical protein VK445_00050, partial [Dissulfurispiraceae bacterium]|nr:hypothetical protein [Dissulfurispiraceae bacterium]
RSSVQIRFPAFSFASVMKLFPGTEGLLPGVCAGVVPGGSENERCIRHVLGCPVLSSVRRISDGTDPLADHSRPA